MALLVEGASVVGDLVGNAVQSVIGDLTSVYEGVVANGITDTVEKGVQKARSFVDNHAHNFVGNLHPTHTIAKHVRRLGLLPDYIEGDIDHTALTGSTWAYLQTLSLVPQGTDAGERLGRVCDLLTLRVFFRVGIAHSLIADVAPTNVTIRIMLAWIHSDLAVLAAADPTILFGSGITPFEDYNHDYEGSLIILREYVHSYWVSAEVPAGPSQYAFGTRTYEDHIDLAFPATFTSQSPVGPADTSGGVLALLVGNDNLATSNTVYVKGAYRTYFIDS